jgi:hypothetical protein
MTTSRAAPPSNEPTACRLDRRRQGDEREDRERIGAPHRADDAGDEDRDLVMIRLPSLNLAVARFSATMGSSCTRNNAASDALPPVERSLNPAVGDLARGGWPMLPVPSSR